MKTRVSEVKRKTSETDITVRLVIDGAGKSSVQTGIGFLDHMLASFAKHGLFDIEVRAKGDIEIDIHHTNEDVAIVLGQAFQKALGKKEGIKRFGFWVLPMDEALVRTALDISGRPSFYFKVSPEVKITERDKSYLLNDAKEFIKSFSQHALINLNMELVSATDPHHLIEAMFKSLAKALDVACQVDSRAKGRIPSTKGKLKE